MKLTIRVLLIISLFFTLHCGGKSGNNVNGPLIDLPSPLITLFDELVGEVAVFNEGGAPINKSPIKFLKDELNQPKFSIPIIVLPKGSIARYVIIFKKDDLDLCYLQFTQSISTESHTDVTIDPESTACFIPADLSVNQKELLNSDVSKGILPNLDIDDDKFSNLQEVLGSSDPKDPDSKPQGPTIKNFKASLSDDTALLTITAEVQDGNGIEDVALVFNNAEYLKTKLSENITKDKNQKKWMYQGVLSTLYPRTDEDLQITLVTKNLLGLSNTQSIRQSVPTNSSSNAGPIIVFENLNPGDTISGTFDLKVSAYDRDGVSQIQLVNPAIFVSGVHHSARAVFTLGTTALDEGINTLTIEAKDSKNVSSTQTINFLVANGSGNRSPTIFIEISSDDEILNSDDEGITSVYGIIKVNAQARDGHLALKSLLLDDSAIKAQNAFINNSDFINTNDTYINSIDTTFWEDGTLLNLSFTAQNEGNLTTKESRLLRIVNKPIINFNVTDSQTGNTSIPSIHGVDMLSVEPKSQVTINMNWQVAYADNVRIVKRTNNMELGSNISLIGELTNIDQIDLSAPNSYETYDLIATHYTNKGTFTSTKQIIVASDLDHDGVGDVIDNCPKTPNPQQLNVVDPQDLDLPNPKGDACKSQIFQSIPIPFNESPIFQVNMGDIDSDNDIDLIGLLYGPASADHFRSLYLTVFKNDGTGNFPMDGDQTLIEGSEPIGAQYLEIGDLDNNGSLDVLLGLQKEETVPMFPDQSLFSLFIRRLINNGRGIFEQQNSDFITSTFRGYSMSGLDFYKPVIVNFNNTPVNEVFLCSSRHNNKILSEDNEVLVNFRGDCGSSLVTYDVDHNGFNELIMLIVNLGPPYSIEILSKAEEGDIPNISLIEPIEGAPQEIALGHLVSTNTTDIVYSGPGSSLTILFNPSETLEQQRIDIGESNLQVLAVSDIDGDGLDDILYASRDLTYLVALFNYGNKIFREGFRLPIVDFVNYISLGDIDGDNDLDLIIQISGGGIKIFKNNIYH